MMVVNRPIAWFRFSPNWSLMMPTAEMAPYVLGELARVREKGGKPAPRPEIRLRRSAKDATGLVARVIAVVPDATKDTDLVRV